MDNLSIPERLVPTEPAGNVGSNDRPSGDDKRRRPRPRSKPDSSEEPVDLPDQDDPHNVDEQA